MRITKLLLVCICFLIAAPAVWGQAANSPAKPGILGYLDPHTGAFRPLPLAIADDAEAPAATTFTGTVSLTITVTLKTTGITNVTCIAEVAVLDGTTSFTSYAESDTVAGTGTGTTRTCKLSIPYSWSLTAQTTDNYEHELQCSWHHRHERFATTYGVPLSTRYPESPSQRSDHDSDGCCHHLRRLTISKHGGRAQPRLAPFLVRFAFPQLSPKKSSILVTSNLDSGYEKRRLKSCAKLSRNRGAEQHPARRNHSCANSLFRNILRVSSCESRFCGA